MRSTIAIDVAAPAELVFRIASDVTRWPDLLPHYVSVRPVGSARREGELLARMVARRPLFGLLGLGIPVTWRARTWNEPGSLRLRFVHVAGATKGMDVTWRIEPTDGGCRVSIVHDFRPGWPFFAVVVPAASTVRSPARLFWPTAPAPLKARMPTVLAPLVVMAPVVP